MFTIADYDPTRSTKYRYLIKHRGVWKIFTTWANRPNWDNEVTDVIWLKSQHTTENWRLMKNKRRYFKRSNPIVSEKEIVLLLLQVEDM